MSTKNVSKATDACPTGLNKLLIIATAILVSGILISLIPIFVTMSSVQSAALTGVGIPLFIFGMVMFGIVLTTYVKRV